MAEIKYNITGAANVGPINAATKGLDALAERSGAAQNMMQSLEAASQGNVTAMFSFARAAKALWTAIQAGQTAVPIMLAISAAVWAINKAYTFFKERADKAAEAQKNYARATDDLIVKLRAHRQTAQDISWDAQIKALDALVKAYTRAAAAAEALAKAQGEQRALKGAAGRSELEARYTREMRKAAPEERENIRANMARELAAYDYEQRRGELQAQAALIAAQRNAPETGLAGKLNQLVGLRLKAGWGAPVRESAQNIAALQAQLRAAGQAGGGAAGKEHYGELAKQLQTAREQHAKLVAQQADFERELDEQIAATKQEIALLDQKENINNAALAALDAEYIAKSELLSLEERRAAEQKAAADAEALRSQRADADAEKSQAALRKEKELADAAAKARAADADRLAKLKDIAAQAQAEAEKKYALATDPAARAAARREARETARKESDWERQVARAESALKREGGAREKLTPSQRRVLEAEDERRLAKEATYAARKLEIQMADDIGKSRVTLDEIRASLERNLSMR